MKVAILHFGFFYSGGGEKLVLEEIAGLKRLGHSVTCFAPYVDREGCFPDHPEIKNVQSLLPDPPAWLPLRHAIWVLACCLLIPLMARRFRAFDVFFGANQPGPWFCYVLSKILGKPYVIYLAQPLRLLYPRSIDVRHGLTIKDGDQTLVKAVTKIGRPIIDWADRASVESAATVLTNGKHVGKWISSVYGVPNQICSAGCKPAARQVLQYLPRWEGTTVIDRKYVDKPFLLVSNRHAPQKRLEFALWALKRVHLDAPEFSLVITGQETEYTSQLRDLTRSLRIHERVHFVGLVNENTLERLYSDAAAYLYPAPEEDFGMGIIEAMAAGTPVVAWNNAGPRYIVEHGVTGFLIDPGDTWQFAEITSQLVSSPAFAEQLGRAAHRVATTEYSYDRHNRLLEQALVVSIRGDIPITLAVDPIKVTTVAKK